MSSTPTITDPTTWALDREIVLVRVLDATREACSPRGPMRSLLPMVRPRWVHLHVREMDVRPGGRAASTWCPETAPCTRTASTTSRSSRASGW